MQCCFGLAAQACISCVTANNIAIGEGGNSLLICDSNHFCQGECQKSIWHLCNVSQPVLSEVVVQYRLLVSGTFLFPTLFSVNGLLLLFSVTVLQIFLHRIFENILLLLYRRTFLFPTLFSVNGLLLLFSVTVLQIFLHRIFENILLLLYRRTFIKVVASLLHLSKSANYRFSMLGKHLTRSFSF